jgi:hypothetical protein
VRIRGDQDVIEAESRAGPGIASQRPERGSAASARSEDTGTTGRPAPKARPCVTLAAIRNPVKEPGPRPKAIASRSRSETPAPRSNSCTIGRISAWCSRGRSSTSSCTVSPSPSATEQRDVEVSIPSNSGTGDALHRSPLEIAGHIK